MMELGLADFGQPRQHRCVRKAGPVECEAHLAKAACRGEWRIASVFIGYDALKLLGAETAEPACEVVTPQGLLGFFFIEPRRRGRRRAPGIGHAPDTESDRKESQ
jgi:hypothetical protein